MLAIGCPSWSEFPEVQTLSHSLTLFVATMDILAGARCSPWGDRHAALGAHFGPILAVDPHVGDGVSHVKRRGGARLERQFGPTLGLPARGDPYARGCHAGVDRVAHQPAGLSKLDLASFGRGELLPKRPVRKELRQFGNGASRWQLPCNKGRVDLGEVAVSSQCPTGGGVTHVCSSRSQRVRF